MAGPAAGIRHRARVAGDPAPYCGPGTWMLIGPLFKRRFLIGSGRKWIIIGLVFGISQVTAYGPCNGLTARNRPGQAGPVRSGRAGNSSRQIFSNFFEFFSPVPGRSSGFFWSNKTLFPEKNLFHHFFTLTRPEPPPKPSYVPKKHPQTIKNKNMFWCFFSKNSKFW